MGFTIYLTFDAVSYLRIYADFYEKLLPLPLKNVQLRHKSCSHRYHILYKECASEYNIWFLFYMACFPLPQIGERNGETFRTEFCFLPRFSACFVRICGLFCFTFAFSKNWFGETFVSKLPLQSLPKIPDCPRIADIPIPYSFRVGNTVRWCLP